MFSPPKWRKSTRFLTVRLARSQLRERTRNTRVGPLAVGDLIIWDPDWDEGGRLSEWKAVMQQAAAMPPTLGAAILWDAWEVLEPLQRQHWLGAQLVSSYLRARGKVVTHLFSLNFDLKFVPRERRRSRDRGVRLLAAL